MADTASEKERYQNDEAGYSLELPEGWQIHETVFDKLKIVYAVSPLDEGSSDFSENLGIAMEELPKEMSSEEYFDLNLPMMKKTCKNLEEVNTGYNKIAETDSKWL
ncbi:MAG: DcrB/PsbP domain-containing protein, partial [Planctomycetota bacterium]